MTFKRRLDTPLGGVTMTGDSEAITGLWFDGQKHCPGTLLRDAEEASLPVFDETERWLAVYFSGIEPDFMPPLAPQGTAFQRAVWALLREVPYGQTTTYGELAVRLGLSSRTARAVGGAVGRNPISLLIPCHRVIGADGRLTGYAGGLARKRALLRLEGIDLDFPADNGYNGKKTNFEGGGIHMDIHQELELHDCPYCGGAALLEEENGWCWYVMCVDCGAQTAAIPYQTPEERPEAARKVANLWNFGKIMRSTNGD